MTLNHKSEKIIRIHYSTQDSTATAGSDYTAQSGTLIFPAGIKRIVLPIGIKGDETPEANETFKIILSDPINATIADNTGIVTISDDDASALSAAQKVDKTIAVITLSPNPAQDKVTVMLRGYSGKVMLQLSTAEGRVLQQQKLPVISAKIAQQSIDVSAYANGVYLVIVIDENGNRKTEKLVIRR